MQKLCFNGGIRRKNKGGIYLTVYSTPFARFLLENGIDRISLVFNGNSFVIRRGKNSKVTMERLNRNQPLCVFSVTKIIPNSLKEKAITLRRQLRVNVLVENFCSEIDIRKHNKSVNSLEPSSRMEPVKENEKIDIGCAITCFRSKNSSFYRFSVRHRILEEIADKKEEIILGREKNGNFTIRKNPKGKKLHLYRYPNGHPLAYLQISQKFLTKKEKEIFKNGRRSISYRAFLSEKEFELDISKFFNAKEERELAYSLLKKGVEISIPKMGERQGDIILKKSGIQIEITNLLPGKASNKNNAHGEGIHINGRLCEGFLRVKKQETPLFVVVFNERWVEQKWVEQLVQQVKPEVIVITTNFKDDWAEDVSRKIVNAANKVL
ncbi:MAG: hypothetical protein NT067_06370 [Candidatus Diapherotrites archaeon]|nr:hypothetical protein [Candidatus Diapherotrites archaeon]